MATTLLADLRGYPLTSDDTVQVRDSVEGGIDALYLLHIRQPTRFIYDFFSQAKAPVIAEVRAEFISGLEDNPLIVALFLNGGAAVWPGSAVAISGIEISACRRLYRQPNGTRVHHSPAQYLASCHAANPTTSTENNGACSRSVLTLPFGFGTTISRRIKHSGGDEARTCTRGSHRI
jgi:hypothetical protein